MTEPEPIYQYIKGQGWVVTNSLAPCYTGYISGLLVTVMARPPELGETGMYIRGDSYNPEYAFNSLFKYELGELWDCTSFDDRAFTVEINGKTRWVDVYKTLRQAGLR